MGIHKVTDRRGRRRYLVSKYWPNGSGRLGRHQCSTSTGVPGPCAGIWAAEFRKESEKMLLFVILLVLSAWEPLSWALPRESPTWVRVLSSWWMNISSTACRGEPGCSSTIRFGKNVALVTDEGLGRERLPLPLGVPGWERPPDALPDVLRRLPVRGDGDGPDLSSPAVPLLRREQRRHPFPETEAGAWWSSRAAWTTTLSSPRRR